VDKGQVSRGEDSAGEREERRDGERTGRMGENEGEGESWSAKVKGRQGLTDRRNRHGIRRGDDGRIESLKA
jgi:hypothetical protein